MDLRGGFKEGSTPSFCLQYSQDLSAIFSLRSFAPFGIESVRLGGLKVVFPGVGSTNGVGTRSGRSHPEVLDFFGLGGIRGFRSILA